MTHDTERLQQLYIDGDASVWPLLQREWVRRGEAWCIPADPPVPDLLGDWVRQYIAAWAIANKTGDIEIHLNPPARCNPNGTHTVNAHGVGFSQRVSVKITPTRWVNIYAIQLDSGERSVRVPSHSDLDEYPIMQSLASRCFAPRSNPLPWVGMCQCSLDQWPVDTFIIPTHDPSSLIVEIR